MMDEREIERIRKMTPGERLVETARMIDEAIPAVLAGPPEIVARRLELLRLENDARNRAMLEAFAKCKREFG